MSNSNSTKLLIIVPTLNSYKILPKLINSIKNQNYTKWRILFIDGESAKEHKRWLEVCCTNNSNIDYIKQNEKNKGIYGAMNQGIDYLNNSEWVLFWGSDDWAANEDVFKNMVSLIDNESENQFRNLPDLFIFNGFYIKRSSERLSRIARFESSKICLGQKEYKKDLFFGSIPPHQATLFRSGILKEIKGFDDKFKLTADLDFFLKLRNKKDLKVLISNQHLVNMSDDGVSARNSRLRFKEVINTYYKHYKYFFIIPFFMRYLRKTYSFFRTYFR